MSEYTSYDVVHVEDLAQVCSALSELECTGVLLAGRDHVLYDDEHLMDSWNTLPYRDKWLVFMSTDDARNRHACLSRFVSLTIDENPERWELRLDKNGETRWFLFSDALWGDLFDADEQGSEHRGGLEDLHVVKTDDLQFMEEMFQTGRDRFSEYLKMGHGKAWHFFKAVGLPVMEKLCDWQFFYPEEGQNRCMLWQEYDKIVSGYDCHLESSFFAGTCLPDESNWSTGS